VHINVHRISTPRSLRLDQPVALLSTSAAAQPATTFRNERGQITGTASTSGSVTTFRDSAGRVTSTAGRMRDGSIQYRDTMGRLTGSTTAPRR
jgi:YD repeat-containing protein